MLRRCLAGVFLSVLLAGCQLSLPGRGDGGGSAAAANPVTAGGITTTRLGPSGAAPAQGDDARASGAPAGNAAAPAAPDAPVPGAPAPAGPAPSASAETADPAAAAPAVPEALKTPQQIACERTGGVWSTVGGSSLRSCVQRTRDGGKRCTRATDCEGACLARSNTCAPVTPLFGCNEVIEGSGTRVTLCLD